LYEEIASLHLRRPMLTALLVLDNRHLDQSHVLLFKQYVASVTFSAARSDEFKRVSEDLRCDEVMQLLTIWGAKGHEFTRVIVLGAEDQGEAETEERTRLLFVAMTRAVEELHVFSVPKPGCPRQPERCVRRLAAAPCQHVRTRPRRSRTQIQPQTRLECLRNLLQPEANSSSRAEEAKRPSRWCLWRRPSSSPSFCLAVIDNIMLLPGPPQPRRGVFSTSATSSLKSHFCITRIYVFTGEGIFWKAVPFFPIITQCRCINALMTF